MSSTNFEKIIYDSTDPSPVSLMEYLIFSEEDSKYLVFKFRNNLNQRLHSITVQVDCYDSDYSLIERSTVTFNELDIRQGALFVPSKKMKVDVSTTNIKVSLINAKFMLSEYIQNELRPLSIDDNNELSQKDSKKQAKYQLKIEKKLAKIRNSKKNKNKYKFKSVMKKRTPSYTRFLTIILSVLAVIYIFVSSYFYVDMYAIKFTYKEVTYEIKNDALYVSSVSPYEESVNIPDRLEVTKNFKTYRYNVVGISEKAFEKSNVKVLTINSKVTVSQAAFANSKIENIVNSDLITSIGDYAFENCTNLSSIEAENCTYVGRFAFANCSSLKELIMPNATVAQDSFKGLKSFDTLSIKDTTTDSFANIFDSSITTTKTICTINSLTINRRSISIDYFKNSTFKYLYLTNKEPAVTYGAIYPYALSGGNVTIDEEHEYIDSKIVSSK